jgi:uncharacterized membrane protein (DUF4010 family)
VIISGCDVGISISIEHSNETGESQTLQDKRQDELSSQAAMSFVLAFKMMQMESTRFPVTPIALKMAVALGIGMLAGMEREWSNKDVGIRTFAIVALLGMLASLVGQSVVVASFVGVFLLIAVMNTRSIATDRSMEITTSAALLLNYLLGVLVGLGHIFTPIAGAIVMTMLLAWNTELSRFAGGLQPSEIRSAVLLGLLGIVIYPVLPGPMAIVQSE